MKNYKDHIIRSGSLLKDALVLLDFLSKDSILFALDSNDKLIGSLSDGDVRRGLIKGFSMNSTIDKFIHKNPKFIYSKNNDIQKIISCREMNLRILPVLDEKHRLVNIINFENTKSYLPIDVVIMAGGRGIRLKPLTDFKPKPLIQIGQKTIIEHNIERLSFFGISNFWISINYLGEQIQSHLGNGKEKNISIEYVSENKPMGTIGAVSKINNFINDYILVTNSDLLTKIDYENFFVEFLNSDADLAVLSIPYKVNIPYAVLEIDDIDIKSFQEKPTYTYYSNGGVYLMKKSILKHIPQNQHFNATDLLQKLINLNLKVITFPFSGYWLDIGRHEDLERAKKDISNLKFV